AMLRGERQNRFGPLPVPVPGQTGTGTGTGTEGSAMLVLRIVIVNYRTPGLVVDCLRSLAEEVRAEPNCRDALVENASGDGSAEMIGGAIKSEGWGWAELLVLERNLGFAGGNNAALRPLLAEARPPDYILLLNPDTVVRPGAVRALVDFLER